MPARSSRCFERKRARDISRSRFVSIFRNARCMRRRRVPSEGGKGRAINRRARNARNAAGHRATRDRDHSCQMPSNRFVSCHPVRLWWRARITFVIPRARHRGKCAIFPSLLFSPRSRFVLDYKGGMLATPTPLSSSRCSNSPTNAARCVREPREDAKETRMRVID